MPEIVGRLYRIGTAAAGTTLAALEVAHPGITVELIATNRPLDLLRERIGGWA